MKLSRVCIGIIAGFISIGVAYADTNWMLVGSAPGDSDVYVDLSRLKRDDNLVRAWTLFNNYEPKRHPNGQAWVSMVTLDEINCAEATSRNLSTFLFSEPDGKGKTVESSTEPDKAGSPVPPDSAGDKVHRIACELTRKNPVPHEVVLKCALVYGALDVSSRKADNQELLAYSQERVRAVAPRLKSYEGDAPIQERYKQIAKKNRPLVDALQRDFYDAIVGHDNEKFMKALKEVSVCDRKLGVRNSRVPSL